MQFIVILYAQNSFIWKTMKFKKFYFAVQS